MSDEVPRQGQTTERDTKPAWTERPAVYWNEREGCYCFRASSLGYCEAALSMAALEYESERPPQKLVDRMQESSDMEEESVTRFINEHVDHVGKNLKVVAQEEVVLELEIEGERVLVIGHTDHRVEVYGEYVSMNPEITRDEFLLEAKTLGEGFYRKFAKGQYGMNYLWQISVYGHATGLPVVLFGAPKHDDTLPIIHERFDEPPVSIPTIVRKIAKVLEHVDEGLPPECAGVMWPCPFWKHHIKPTDETITDVSNDEAMLELAELYVETKQAELAKKAELAKVVEDRKNYERELFTWMKDNGDLPNVRIPGVVIKRIRSSSTWPDWDAMEADGIDVNQYKKRSFYEYGKLTTG